MGCCQGSKYNQTQSISNLQDDQGSSMQKIQPKKVHSEIDVASQPRRGVISEHAHNNPQYVADNAIKDGATDHQKKKHKKSKETKRRSNSAETRAQLPRTKRGHDKLQSAVQERIEAACKEIQDYHLGEQAKFKAFVEQDRQLKSAKIDKLEQETVYLRGRIEAAAKERDDYHYNELTKYKAHVEKDRKSENTKQNELQKTIKSLQETNVDLQKRLEEKQNELIKERRMRQSETEEIIDKTNKTVVKYQDEIRDLKQQNDELKIRLSAYFGAKLQDNNPNIADLSDANRPTKLAERFSELYDNEWTNCFEVLTQQKGIVERDAIALMLQTCVKIYKECRTIASQNLDELTRAMHTFDAEANIRVIKDLKESRKRQFKVDIEQIRTPIQVKMTVILKDQLKEPLVAEFWTKCLEICWLMAIQDPPVSMDTKTDRKGDLFNATLYRHYTQSGKYVEYIVWPALQLTEGGSILCKGVAQGTDSLKVTVEQYSKTDEENKGKQKNTQTPLKTNSSPSTNSTKAQTMKTKLNDQQTKSDINVGEHVSDDKNTSEGENCLKPESVDTNKTRNEPENSLKPKSIKQLATSMYVASTTPVSKTDEKAKTMRHAPSNEYVSKIMIQSSSAKQN